MLRSGRCWKGEEGSDFLREGSNALKGLRENGKEVIYKKKGNHV